MFGETIKYKKGNKMTAQGLVERSNRLITG